VSMVLITDVMHSTVMKTCMWLF